MRSLALCALLALGLLLATGCGKGSKSGKEGEEGPEGKSEKMVVKGPLVVPKATGTPSSAPEHGLGPDLERDVQAALAKARTWLLTQQEKSGGFTDHGAEGMKANVSFTAMAVAALVAATPRTQVGEDAAIHKGLKFLVGFQQPDGSIVDDPKWTNYCTSAAVSALAAAKVGDFAKAQARAAAYLEGSQIQGDMKDPNYGGFPYKEHSGQTADGSNAFMATNALDANGLPADSPVRKRVEVFASGLQNRSESNTRKTVVKTEDGTDRTVVAGDNGGGYYRVGESKAGMIKRSDGTWELRSYGSMTYAVLKLMLFAGLDAKDPRVQALVGWISKHWTVDRNPGFENAEKPEAAGQQGYFYFLYSAARALSSYEKVSGQPLVVRDAEGRKHNWRYEIAQSLLLRQGKDGSWRNPVDRWMEGMQTLATSFAMQTLGVLDGRLD
jgi:squalene-hopene/tetraprenyl-beta-curcumene cyclase